MSDQIEHDLTELISSEQRGFRRILFAGFGILLVVVAMSAALGIYYFSVSNTLKETSENLTRDAFEARIELDRHTNQVANLERAIRRTYDEFRDASVSAAGRFDRQAAIAAVTAYLQRGSHSLNDELLIEAAVESRAPASAETRALLSGARDLLRWERSGEQIARGMEGLPPVLASASAAFEQAAADPELVHIAQTGLAWIRFIDASSNRASYQRAYCEEVFSAIQAIRDESGPGPQPLYWRAQCERKLGLTIEALGDYARALAQNGTMQSESRDEAALTLAMNAFHGVGTQLIATSDVADEDLREQRALAAETCGAGEATDHKSDRMKLARACLDRAIDLRRQLRQTSNQVSGTGENITFAYLRDRQFQEAFNNTVSVERTGLFPWNELARALTASHLNTQEARTAGREARRNVRFFDIERFNPCELQVLLSADLFEEARSIVEAEHRGKSLACTPAESA